MCERNVLKTLKSSSLLGNPPAFIQCGEWVFPLVPGKSPVLKAADATYMFPELQGDGKFL